MANPLSRTESHCVGNGVAVLGRLGYHVLLRLFVPETVPMIPRTALTQLAKLVAKDLTNGHGGDDPVFPARAGFAGGKGR